MNLTFHIQFIFLICFILPFVLFLKYVLKRVAARDLHGRTVPPGCRDEQPLPTIPKGWVATKQLQDNIL